MFFLVMKFYVFYRQSSKKSLSLVGQSITEHMQTLDDWLVHNQLHVLHFLYIANYIYIRPA